MDLNNRKILFAVSSMGLGHVYRSLPVIHFLINSGSRITILSHGRALKALKIELAEHGDIEYIEYQEYPSIQQPRGVFQDLLLLKDLIHTGFLIRKERTYLNTLIAERQIDMVFADGRFGFTSAKIPCFLICHQVRFLLPLRLRIFQPLMDLSLYNVLKRYTKVVVPDHEDYKENLTGILSHNWIARRLKVLYIGFLSSAKRVPVDDQIDVLFITGGFIDRERKLFITWAREHLQKTSQRVVVVQGEHTSSTKAFEQDSNLEIYANITGHERDSMLSATRVLAGRSGSTTIMDVCELKIQAALLPTPRMTEQAYLAKYLANWEDDLPKHFKASSRQPWVGFDATALPPSIKAWSTQQSMEKLADFLSSYIHEK